MTEEEVMIDGRFPIGATIAYNDTDRKSPAIVIIMGTGKTDRDGNIKNYRMNIYKDMSDLFSECGYVTARYDKRGTHRSEGDMGSAGLNDLVDDAISVIQYVKSLPYVDENRVFVCGHSEGAIIATILSGKEDVAGLMLLGGAAMSLKDALRYQNREVAEEASSKKGIMGLLMKGASSEEKNCAKVDAMFRKCSETDRDTVWFGGAKIAAKWIREHDSYTSDVLIGMLRSYGGPVLAITGKADLSADWRWLDNISDRPDTECYAPDNVNHILREIDDDNSIMHVKKQYLRLSKNPMHEGTREVIRRWLESRL